MSVTLDRQTTATTIITNSAAETVAYTFTVPANTVTNSGILRGKLVLIYIQGSGVAQTIRVRGKWGGSTLIDDTSISIPSTVTVPRSVVIDFELAQQGAGSGNLTMLMSMEISQVGPSATVSGDWTTVALLPPETITATSLVLPNAARVLEISLQLSAATATQTVTRRYAYLELV